MKKNIATFALMCITISTLLSGCGTPRIKVSNNLVGNGTLHSSIEGFKALDEKEKKSVLEAAEKKYGGLKVISMKSDITVDVSAQVPVYEGMMMNLKMDMTDKMSADFEKQVTENIFTGNMELFGFVVDYKGSLYTDENYTYKNMKTITSDDISAADNDIWSKEPIKEDKNPILAFGYTIPKFTDEYIKNVYKSEIDNSYIFELNGTKLQEYVDGNRESISRAASSMNSSTFESIDSFDFTNGVYYLNTDSGIGLIGYYIDMSKAYNTELSDSDTESKKEDLEASIVATMKFNVINDGFHIDIPADALSAAVIDTDNKNEYTFSVSNENPENIDEEDSDDVIEGGTDFNILSGFKNVIDNDMINSEVNDYDERKTTSIEDLLEENETEDDQDSWPTDGEQENN